MIKDQVSLEAASAPSWGSVAEPEKDIVSPTFQVVVGDGETMVAVGAVFVFPAPALMVSG
jgi:hypothetical protein